MLNNETILPNHQGQNDYQNQINTKLYGNSNSSRQNQGIPTTFQINRVSIMPLRRREPNCGSPTLLLRQTREEKEKLITDVSSQDKWPVNKRDLVNKYKNISNSSSTEKNTQI